MNDYAPFIKVYICLECGGEIAVYFHSNWERDEFIPDDESTSSCCDGYLIFKGNFNLVEA
jgi:hypothetical protein